MVGEHAVRRQITAAGNISPQRRKHLFGKKAARTVAGIHHNMKPRQRVQVVFGLHAVPDKRGQMRGIYAHKILLLHLLCLRRGLRCY